MNPAPTPTRTPTQRAARRACPRCALPLPSCLCAWLRPTANQASLLILQHPMERDQAKGSARLLRLSLAHCHCEPGERFDPEVLAGWLSATQAGRAVRSLLLFPQAPGQPQEGASAEALAGLVEADELVRWQLVVLDATWRKARKMLALNPLLQALPRWGLQALPPSRYAIRKAQRPEQRSTLEAACLGLGQLEGEPARYEALLSAFDGWVAESAARAPGAPSSVDA